MGQTGCYVIQHTVPNCVVYIKPYGYFDHIAYITMTTDEIIFTGNACENVIVEPPDDDSEMPEYEGQQPAGHTPLVYGQTYKFSSPDVAFDLDADGVQEILSWPLPGTKLLALDRNGNGRIDSGKELFGTGTFHGVANGFIAASAFDSNGNSMLDPMDQVWNSLMLWNDLNHDGQSQVGELISVDRDTDIYGFGLDYTHTKRLDPNGAELLLRAEVWTSYGKRHYYDAFLKKK